MACCVLKTMHCVKCFIRTSLHYFKTEHILHHNLGFSITSLRTSVYYIWFIYSSIFPFHSIPPLPQLSVFNDGALVGCNWKSIHSSIHRSAPLIQHQLPLQQAAPKTLAAPKTVSPPTKLSSHQYWCRNTDLDRLAIFRIFEFVHRIILDCSNQSFVIASAERS